MSLLLGSLRYGVTLFNPGAQPRSPLASAEPGAYVRGPGPELSPGQLIFAGAASWDSCCSCSPRLSGIRASSWWRKERGQRDDSHADREHPRGMLVVAARRWVWPRIAGHPRESRLSGRVPQSTSSAGHPLHWCCCRNAAAARPGRLQTSLNRRAVPAMAVLDSPVRPPRRFPGSGPCSGAHSVSATILYGCGQTLTVVPSRAPICRAVHLCCWRNTCFLAVDRDESGKRWFLRRYPDLIAAASLTLCRRGRYAEFNWRSSGTCHGRCAMIKVVRLTGINAQQTALDPRWAATVPWASESSG